MMRRKIVRLALTVAYGLLVRWERLTKASKKGAAVAIWYKGQILVVRHSYRPGSSLPGGEVKKNEEPAVAASRELREEVGIQVEPETLISVHEGRSGEVLFEFHPRVRPDLKIDNFEIIEARFVDPVDIADPDYKLSVYLRRATGTAQKSVVL